MSNVIKDVEGATYIAILIEAFSYDILDITTFNGNRFGIILYVFVILRHISFLLAGVGLCGLLKATIIKVTLSPHAIIGFGYITENPHNSDDFIWSARNVKTLSLFAYTLVSNLYRHKLVIFLLLFQEII